MERPSQAQAISNTALVSPPIADMQLELDVRTKIASTNFEPFEARAREFLSSINNNLVTEDDFAIADQDCDMLKKIEDNIRMTIRNVASGNAEIEHVLKLAGDLADEFRNKRLSLEKLVDKERQTRKKAIIDEALLQLTDQIAENVELIPMLKITMPVLELRRRLEDGGRNKKGLSGYQKGVAVALTSLQLELNSEIIRLQERLAMIPVERAYLFHDRIPLVASLSDLETIVYKRLREDEHRKELEAEMRRQQEETVRQAEMAKAQNTPVVESVRVHNLERRNQHDGIAGCEVPAHTRKVLPQSDNEPVLPYCVNIICTKSQAIFIGKLIKADFPDIFQNITKGA